MKKLLKEIPFPKNFNTLKSIPTEYIENIWQKIFETMPSGNKQTISKAIWYKYQCEINNTKLSQVYKNKLERYSKNPEKFLSVSKSHKCKIHPGSIIKKEYKGRHYQTIALPENKFEYNNKVFNNLSAVATEICGFNVSGYDFFGLRRERKNEKN